MKFTPMERDLLLGTLDFKIRHHSNCAARCGSGKATAAHDATISRLCDLRDKLKDASPLENVIA